MSEDRVLRKRILLADDDPGVRQAVKFLLRLDEHEVKEAWNGKQALELFTTQTFDLIITDCIMPEMDGCELAKRIKGLAPSQPIIMISGWARRLSIGDNQVDVLLNKPFMFADLRRAIAKLVSS
jgi:CheY-like chemotaxis protein